MEKQKNPVVLSVKNLNVYFKSHGKDAHVIRGINIDINREECFAIVGESGSGKSVFTKTFTGMLDSNGKIKSGTIIMNDIPIADPKIIRARFKDIHLFKAKERVMKAHSVSEVYDHRVKVLKRDFELASKKIDYEMALAEKDSHRKLLKEALQKKYDKERSYYTAFYTDKLNRAYNQVSNNGIKRQKVTDRLSNFLISQLVDERFEERDHVAEFMPRLDQSLASDSAYNTCKKLYSSLEEEAKKYADNTPGQKLVLTKLYQTAQELSSKFRVILTRELTAYVASQKPAKPINAPAAEEFSSFLKKPLSDLFAKFEAPELLKGLPAAASADSNLDKIIQSQTEQIRAFAKKYVDLSKKQDLPSLTDLSVEGFEELIDLIRSHLFTEKNYIKITEQLADCETRLEGVLSDENRVAFTERRIALQRQKAVYEIESLEKNYLSHAEYLKKKTAEAPESLQAYVHDFYSELYSAAVKILELPSMIKKQMLKLRVDEIRSEKLSTFQKIDEKQQNEYDLRAKSIVTDEAKLQTASSRKTDLESKYQADLKRLEEEKIKAVAAQKGRNAAVIEKSLLTPEEKVALADYQSKDLVLYVERAKKIAQARERQEVLVADIKKKIAETVEAFDAGDMAKVRQLSAVIGFNFDFYQKRLEKIKAATQASLLDIEAKIKKAGQGDKADRQIELLNIEREAVQATDIANIEQVKIELRKALVSFNIENNRSVRRADTEVHNAVNVVNPLTIRWRRFKERIHIRVPMLISLRQRGVVRGESVNLAKFKSNREWSMIRGSHIATIFQDPMTSLNPLLTIGSQITDVLRLHHNLTQSEAKKEAIELLKKVHIPNAKDRYNDYPYQYSGGMRQRVVIAIALACRPDILICDEPTTALDVTVQAQILSLIKELQKEYHFTTIFITHDLGVVAGVADRIAVMYGGQIIEYGTDEDIFYSPAHPYTWALLSSLPQLAADNEPLTYIRGNPPVFTEEIEGDSFAPRSDYAMRIDSMKEPPMFKISETHFAKTWLLDPRAPKVKKPVLIRNLSERMKVTAASFLASTKGE